MLDLRVFHYSTINSLVYDKKLPISQLMTHHFEIKLEIKKNWNVYHYSFDYVGYLNNTCCLCMYIGVGKKAGGHGLSLNMG